MPAAPSARSSPAGSSRTLEFLDRGTLQAVEAFAGVGLPTDAAARAADGAGRPARRLRCDIAAMADVCRRDRRPRSAGGGIAGGSAPADGGAPRRVDGACPAQPDDVLEDATVPRSRIAEMVAAIQGIAARYELDICTFGHAGDGNSHPPARPMSGTRKRLPGSRRRLPRFSRPRSALGGTITGEHGVGLAKAPYLEWKVGEAGMAVMRGIKQAFDPHGILNPGKIFGQPTRERVVVRHGVVR